MTTSSRSSSGPRLDNRCSRLLLPAVQFRFQATSGDASGLKAVKPEVCHEEQNTEATAVLPASEPDLSSPKPPDAGLSRRASLGDTFLILLRMRSRHFHPLMTKMLRLLQHLHPQLW